MSLHKHLAVLIFLVFLFQGPEIFAQTIYSYSLNTRPEICRPGSAEFLIGGLHSADKLNVDWSTGENDFTSIKNLDSGAYWVKVRITSRQDTVDVTTDTTLVFRIEKKICPVSIPKHFPPNDDGYNDQLSRSNIHKHP